jgi:DNA-directed RNA polymerase, alpha subunit/40 kD subunit
MITITFEVECQEEGTMLMTFYETIKRERKFLVREDEQQSDFEKRMKSLSLDDLIFWPNGLDVRAANCLRNEGLMDAYSIGTMFARDNGRTMLKIPNLGRKSVKTVEACLHQVGFFK